MILTRIEEAYKSGVIEGGIMNAMNYSYDVDGISKHYAFMVVCKNDEPIERLIKNIVIENLNNIKSQDPQNLDIEDIANKITKSICYGE